MNERPEDPFQPSDQASSMQMHPGSPPVTPEQYEILQAQQEHKDGEHLNLLAIFHYVWAGLVGLGALGLIAYLFMMEKIFKTAMMSVYTVSATPAGAPTPASTPGSVVTSSPAAPSLPPEAIDRMINMMYIMYGTLAALMLIGCVCNIISARGIQKKKNRVFSLVVSAINCLMFPLGTVLGVFSFVILCRDSVAQLYGRVLGARP